MNLYEKELINLRWLLEAERMLMELLCLIHGDGGHYIVEHGVKKAYQDGQDIILADRQSLEANIASRKQAQIEREQAIQARNRAGIEFRQQRG